MGNVLIRFDPELFMDRYSLTGEDRKLIRNEVFRSVESCSTWMFLPLPRACALWAWNGNIPFGEMIMMVWISLILLICAGFSAYAGASQLEQAKQHAKCSLDAFTKRRNGVSCICLSILFVILGVAINL